MASLYSDLVETSEAQELKKLKEELEQARTTIQRLKDQLARDENEKQSIMEENQTLKANISAIYHTAKKEIQRKDAMIADLRSQIGSLPSSTQFPPSAPPSSSSFAAQSAFGSGFGSSSGAFQSQQHRGSLPFGQGGNINSGFGKGTFGT